MSIASENLKTYLRPRDTQITPVQVAAIIQACDPEPDWLAPPFSILFTQLVEEYLHNLTNVLLLCDFSFFNKHKQLQKYFDECDRNADLRKMFEGVAYSHATFSSLQKITDKPFQKAGVKGFIKRAKAIAKAKFKNGTSLQDVENAIASLLSSPRIVSNIKCQIVAQSNLLTLARLHAYDPEKVEEIRKTLNPQNGPQSLYELMYLSAFYRVTQSADIEVMQHFSSNAKIVDAAATELQEAMLLACRDLPPEQLKDQVSKELATNRKMVWRYTITTNEMIGFTRYFLGHNADKLSQDDYIAILERLSIVAEAQAVNMKPILDKTPTKVFSELDAEIPQLARDTHQAQMRTWMNYPKPTIEDVTEQIEKKFREKYPPSRAAKEIKKFHEARKQIPDYMEECVIWHARENQTIRELRKRIFKLKTLHTGEDGPKKAFLKKIALSHQSELLDLGFSENQIMLIAQNGSIPENYNGEELTVEHIIDREIGGNNFEENFTLMPEQTNKAKDFLKRRQMAAQTENENLGWTITWVPRTDEFGNIPAVIVPDRDYKLEPERNLLEKLVPWR